MTRYRKLRIVLGVLFTLSTLIFIGLYVYPMLKPAETPDGPRMRGTSDIFDSISSSVVATATSCATSIASFLGLVSATLIAWRKERREAQLLEIESKKKEIELAKKRLQLQELKETKEKPKKRVEKKPRKATKPKRGKAAKRK